VHRLEQPMPNHRTESLGLSVVYATDGNRMLGPPWCLSAPLKREF
jgi:hypothetical protein